MKKSQLLQIVREATKEIFNEHSPILYGWGHIHQGETVPHCQGIKASICDPTGNMYTGVYPTQTNTYICINIGNQTPQLGDHFISEAAIISQTGNIQPGGFDTSWVVVAVNGSFANCPGGCNRQEHPTCTYQHVYGCTVGSNANYNPLATVNCTVPPIAPQNTWPDPTDPLTGYGIGGNNDMCLDACLYTYGCGDITANNYNANATGNCDTTAFPPYQQNQDPAIPNTTYTSAPCCFYDIPGCIDPLATNYGGIGNINGVSPFATVNDNSCIHVLGCTDANALNFNEDCNGNPVVATQIDPLCPCTYPVPGCTDPNAVLCASGIGPNGPSSCNPYNPLATNDDGSCCVLGCTDPTMSNYNALATCDDSNCIPYTGECKDPNASQNACTTGGSCTPYDPNAIADCNADPNGNDNSCCCYEGCTNTMANGPNCGGPNTSTGPGCYDPNATCDDGSCVIEGCTVLGAINYGTRCDGVDMTTFGMTPNYDDGCCVVEGCTDPNSACPSGQILNATPPSPSTCSPYDPSATVDDGSCCIQGCTDTTNPLTSNLDIFANCDDGSCLYDILGCADPSAILQVPGATLNCDGTAFPPYQGPPCCTYDLYGCTDSISATYPATNINTNATAACDGIGNPPNSPSPACFGGLPPGTPDCCCDGCVYGCTDPAANNQNPASLASELAYGYTPGTCDDASCTYTPPVFGCTETFAQNYDNLADGCEDPNTPGQLIFSPTPGWDICCDYHIAGCMNIPSPNYDPNATINATSYPPFTSTVQPITPIISPALGSPPQDLTDPCIYPQAGCTNSASQPFSDPNYAFNYDPSLDPLVDGCMDINGTIIPGDDSCCPGCTDNGLQTWSSNGGLVTAPSGIAASNDTTTLGFGGCYDNGSGTLQPSAWYCCTYDPITYDCNGAPSWACSINQQGTGTYNGGTSQQNLTNCQSVCNPPLVGGCPTINVTGVIVAAATNPFCATCETYNSTTPADGCEVNGIVILGDTSCCCPIGCTDGPLGFPGNATNYNPNACIDDGSCLYSLPVAGCSDPNINGTIITPNPFLNTCPVGNTCVVYDPLADGCEINGVVIPGDTSCCCTMGCTDLITPNPTIGACIDDGSCVAYGPPGCVDNALIDPIQLPLTNSCGVNNTPIVPGIGFNPPYVFAADNTSIWWSTPNAGCPDVMQSGTPPDPTITSCCEYYGCLDPTATNYTPTWPDNYGNPIPTTGCPQPTGMGNHDGDPNNFCCCEYPAMLDCQCCDAGSPVSMQPIPANTPGGCSSWNNVMTGGNLSNCNTAQAFDPTDCYDCSTYNFAGMTGGGMSAMILDAYNLGLQNGQAHGILDGNSIFCVEYCGLGSNTTWPCDCCGDVHDCDNNLLQPKPYGCWHCENPTTCAMQSAGWNAANPNLNYYNDQASCQVAAPTNCLNDLNCTCCDDDNGGGISPNVSVPANTPGGCSSLNGPFANTTISNCVESQLWNASDCASSCQTDPNYCSTNPIADPGGPCWFCKTPGDECMPIYDYLAYGSGPPIGPSQYMSWLFQQGGVWVAPGGPYPQPYSNLYCSKAACLADGCLGTPAPPPRPGDDLGKDGEINMYDPDKQDNQVTNYIPDEETPIDKDLSEGITLKGKLVNKLRMQKLANIKTKK